MIEIHGRGFMNNLSVIYHMKQMIERSIQGAVAKGAHELMRDMREGLRDQSPGGKPIKPLSPMTIALRSMPRMGTKAAANKTLKKAGKVGTKALIRHGDLLRSIKAERSGSESWTVGVHRGARGKKTGADMANIAAIQNYGSEHTVTVTEKMRRFSMVLMSMGILKAPWRVGQVMKIKIPPRPFLTDAYDYWGKSANEAFAKRLAEVAARVRGMR